jgi:PQQ-like domain
MDVRRLGRPLLFWAALAGAATVGAGFSQIPMLYLAGCGLLALVLAAGSYRLVEPPPVGLLVVVPVLSLLVGVPWLLLRASEGDNVQWTAEGSPAWGAFRLDDRIYVAETKGFAIVDPRTGENLGTFRSVLPRKRVTNSGLIAFSGDDRVEVYSAKDGKILDVAGDMVAAAAGDAIVVIDCARGVEAMTRPCSYRGYGPGGRLRWTRTGYQRGVTAPYRQYGKAISSNLELSEVPEVLVTMTAAKDGATVLRSPADGRELYRRARGGRPVVAGDLAVFGERGTDGRCRLEAIRAGARQWTAEYDCDEWHPQPVGRYLYDRVPGGIQVVELDGGATRLIGGDSDARSDADRTALGTDVVVTRRRNELHGIDPRTGEELWRMDVPGRRVAGVSTSAGAVDVLHQDLGRNPLRSAGEREDGVVVLVLDALTGKKCGRYSDPAQIWASYAVGPGQVLVGDRDGTLRLVGCRQ